jgi:hypothetical protein
VAGAAEAKGALAFDATVFAAGFFTGADFFATFAVAAVFAAFRTFAHRAFWAAAILARASALKLRFFLLFAGNPAAGAFFAAFLDFAQRALWAAAILSRPLALNVRFVLALTGKLALAGRAGFRFPVAPAPANSAFTCCSLDISASISTTMSWFLMSPLRY